MFDMTPLPDGFTVEMATDLDNVDRCVELMRAFLEERGAQEHLFAISLLTREAVNNAMIHGNRMDAGKRVRLRFLVREEGFDLEVEDQGPGFAWQNHVSPEAVSMMCTAGGMRSTATSPAPSDTTNGAMS
jgi:serine/threonine-protein kinase RsbW